MNRFSQTKLLKYKIESDNCDSPSTQLSDDRYHEAKNTVSNDFELKIEQYLKSHSTDGLFETQS